MKCILCTVKHIVINFCVHCKQFTDMDWVFAFDLLQCLFLARVQCWWNNTLGHFTF